MHSFPTPLITAAELHELLGSRTPPPTLLDVRWQVATGADRDGYDEGHIPGASFVDLDAQFAAPPGPGGRHPLPPADPFAADMRARGVRSDRPVVIYDGANSTAAARGWWLLCYFGHPAVAVLDGGLAAWETAGFPLSAEEPTAPSGASEQAAPAGFSEQAAPAGDFIARPGGMPVLDADGAAKLAERGILLDARAPERFGGLFEPLDPVAGHIPGARNLPTTQNVDPSGRFLGPDELRHGFETTGVSADLELGAYCGSGITAAHEVLALELAGYRAALYPGSWSEWITEPSRPVARDP